MTEFTAWGPGPVDNDTAISWLKETLQPVFPRIEAALTRDDADPDEKRAAVFLLEKIGFEGMCEDDHLKHLLVAASSSMQELAQDDEWIESWEDGDVVRTALLGEASIMDERSQDAAIPGALPLSERIKEIEPVAPEKRGSDGAALRALKKRLTEE